MRKVPNWACGGAPPGSKLNNKDEWLGRNGRGGGRLPFLDVVVIIITIIITVIIII